MPDFALTKPTFWILIALANGRCHGYDILRETARASEGAVSLKATTLYAALERMQREGLIDQDGEEIVNGRARRYYLITEQGSVALAHEAAMLERQAKVARERLDRVGIASVKFGFAV